MRLLVLALACLHAGLAFALPPHKLSLQYELSYNGIVAAELTETLEHDARSYTLVSEGRGKGLGALLFRGAATRVSKGEVTASGLRPLEYVEKRGDRPETRVKFDWKQRRLIQDHEGRVQTAELGANTYDRLSFLYDFAFRPSSAFARAGEVVAAVTDGRGATIFHYAVAGEELLDTPVGKLETVHLVKQREGKEDKATELWFARAHAFLPVRILVIEKDGTRIDQVLARIDAR